MAITYIVNLDYIQCNLAEIQTKNLVTMFFNSDLFLGFGKTCENDTFMCNSGNDGVIFFVSIRHTYILKYFNPP